ncbi:MAG: ATP-dependent helicase [Acidimicrobiales bacterium]
MFDLNEQQRAAVAHRGGPLLVAAGAGTGKTGTLASRVADLIASGVPPGRICLLTFTRRAAREMLARAGDLTSAAVAAQVCGGTFHGVAHRVLRAYGRRLGLGPDFTVLDQAGTCEVIDLVRHDVLSVGGRLGGGGASGRRFPRPDTLASIYSRVVATGRPLSRVVGRDFPWCRTEVVGIGAVFDGYTARKRVRRMLDFEDLLLAWQALGATPGGAELLGGLWDQVLVDEYQDTNPLQADILRLLRPDGAGLTVVGDEAQAIYAFRAATAGNLARFGTDFPGTTVIRLEENYRSIPPVLVVANAVLAAAPATTGSGEDRLALWSRRAGQRRPLLRRCEDEAAQAEAVCDSVLAHRDRGVPLQRQAVLFRASHHADLLELALARRNIPYVKYGGLRVLEAAHVRDLLAALRVLANPWDEVAWFRLLTLVDGVGPATARRVMAALGLEAVAGSGAEPDVPGGWPDCDPAATPMSRLLAAPPSLADGAAPKGGLSPGSGASRGLAELRAALSDCADGCLPGGGTPDPAVQIERLARWLGPIVERRYKSPAARLEDLAQLGRAAAGYPDRGLFLGEITLDPPAATGDLAGPPLLDEDWLVLSTVHSAKGGEWDAVHVLHATDGMFPADMACGDAEGIEEERRLLYVAVTRARDILEIYVPQRYHVARDQFRRFSDVHLYAQVSRFLTDDVQALMDHQMTLAPPASVPVDAFGAPEAGSLAAVDSFLSGLWH